MSVIVDIDPRQIAAIAEAIIRGAEDAFGSKFIERDAPILFVTIATLWLEMETKFTVEQMDAIRRAALDCMRPRAKRD